MASGLRSRSRSRSPAREFDSTRGQALVHLQGHWEGAAERGGVERERERARETERSGENERERDERSCV